MKRLILIAVAVGAFLPFGWEASAGVFLIMCALGFLWALIDGANFGFHHEHDVYLHLPDGISDPTYPDEHPIVPAEIVKRRLGRKL